MPWIRVHWVTGHPSYRRTGPGYRWRTAVLKVLLLATLLWVSSGGAQSSDVPVQIQAELLAKLVSYDRNFRARAHGTARTVILVKKGAGRSRLAGESFKSALGKLDLVGGLQHEERIVVYDTAAAIQRLCESGHIAILYVTPGLEEEVEALSSALSGTSVLTASPLEEHVSRGVVLGFELVSGKTKLVLNLPQARRQGVDFSANVLRLMKVRQ